jgi:hypothetical protein
LREERERAAKALVQRRVRNSYLSSAIVGLLLLAALVFNVPMLSLYAVVSSDLEWERLTVMAPRKVIFENPADEW